VLNYIKYKTSQVEYFRKNIAVAISRNSSGIFANNDDKITTKMQSNKILAAINLPVKINHEFVQVTASLGWAIFPFDGGTLPELMLSADHALYAAKRSGKAQAKQAQKQISVEICHREIAA
jgi:predicted signal transduction protein with EAL and GGDEF domain